LNDNDPRAVFQVTLQAEPWPGPVDSRLKRALKCLKRSFGFKVVTYRQLPPEPPKTDAPGPPNGPGGGVGPGGAGFGVFCTFRHV
jgi:hypothetical protein